jgi:hypothetical protein
LFYGSCFCKCKAVETIRNNHGDGLSDGLYGDFGTHNQAITQERKNLLRRIDGKFYTEEMLADSAGLRKFGFNEREVNCLAQNPWWDLESLYVKTSSI